MSLPLNQVLCGDCLKVLSGFPAKSVDLILTDPPYNIAKDGKLALMRGEIKTTKEAWGETFKDDFTETEYFNFMLELAKQYDRVLSDTGSLITFYDRGHPEGLIPYYDRFHFRNMIVFVKKNPTPQFRKNNYRSGYEQCAWFSRERYNINFISQRKMINVIEGYSGVLFGQRGGKKTEHPTEKYEWMILPLIERHSNENDTILDPMCGSGTVLECAKKLNRNFIGIDINQKWVNTSNQRLVSTPLSLSVFQEAAQG